MKRALAALLFALTACEPAPQSDAGAAAPAAPSPITPAHNGGRFQVVTGRSFEVVLDPAIPPATLWRLVATPDFIQHIPLAGGSPMGGEPPQTSAFNFFASFPSEGELVFAAPDGAQFRVTIVATAEQAGSWVDPFPPSDVVRLNSIASGGRVEVVIGQRMEFHSHHSSSRGEVVEPAELPTFVEYLGERSPPSEEPMRVGGSHDYIYEFVARAPGEGVLVIQEYNQRDNLGAYEVFRATIVAR